MLTDIRVLADPFLCALTNINTWQEPRAGLDHVVDQEPKAWGSPEPKAEAAVESSSVGSLCQRVRASMPDGYSLRALGRS
jgi:hypothetical protein